MALAEGSSAEQQSAVAQQYGTIVVVGGGCYGGYYVRQLRRARERGALTFDTLTVVDRDASCAVAAGTAADGAGDVTVVIAEWHAFFSEYLGGHAHDNDAIVPSPLMPHLLFQWLEQRARERWPDRRIAVEMPGAVTGVPWQREGGESTRYVSFAEWMCPVNCIEPRICPHTRDVRAWSLPPSIRAQVDAARERGERLDGPAIFHCTHRAYGVGMIDVRDVLEAERQLVHAVDSGTARLLVGTVSHCHGALGVLSVASATR